MYSRIVVHGDRGRAATEADVRLQLEVVLEADDVVVGREVDGVAGAVRRPPGVRDVAAGGVDQVDVGGGVRRDEQVAGVGLLALEEADSAAAGGKARARH